MTVAFRVVQVKLNPIFECQFKPSPITNRSFSLPLRSFDRHPQNANQNMSENQTKGPNQVKRTTNHLINEQLAKIQQDTAELINRTIHIGQPAQVSVVKVSDNKIIIEVDVSC